MDLAGGEPTAVVIIDGGEEQDHLRPAADAIHAEDRRHEDMHAREGVMEGVAHLAGLAAAIAHHAPIRLLG